jgi:hypothetical protein
LYVIEETSIIRFLFNKKKSIEGKTKGNTSSVLSLLLWANRSQQTNSTNNFFLKKKKVKENQKVYARQFFIYKSKIKIKMIYIYSQLSAMINLCLVMRCNVFYLKIFFNWKYIKINFFNFKIIKKSKKLSI